MSDERWRRTEELFHGALALPGADRERQVAQWCRGEPGLYDDVMALIVSDSEVEQLLATQGPAPGPQTLLREAGSDAGTDPWVGRTVGSFVLDSVIGRGGMGVVYRGRRRDADWSQTVAVKVIARHLRSSPAVGQFLAEREVLGRLEHKHIARLIDGGLHEDVPYVVMEYVEGERLDALCDQPSTSVATKIDLLLQLCDAVAYVHGHLILHRDLKPGNVMVTAGGQVKLLDFGTLKRMDIEAADSLMTRAGMRSVTLRYASPEHLAGRPVSTATDIYSLGVILHRLLTGRVPRESPGSPGEPPQPIGPIGTAERLRRDLNAITAKAMHAEPGRRYSSVDALARDLRNAVANRPVGARDGTLRYRAGRFMVRRRAFLSGVAATLLTLAVGVAAVVHEGHIAESAAARAGAGVEDERKLAHLLLFDYFEELKRIPGSTEAQRKAVSQALAYLDGLVRGVSASLLVQDRVDAYTKMGNLLGNPYEENIGDSGGAIQTLGKAVALSRLLLARDPADLRFLQSAAAAELALGRVYFGMGDPQRAVQYLRPAAASSERIAGTAGVDAATIAQAASVVDSLGDVYGQEGAVTLDDPATAISIYQRAQAIDAQGLQLDPQCARCRRGIGLEYWKVGMLTEPEDQERAAELYNHGLDTLAAFSAADQATARVRRMDTVLRQRLAGVLLAAGHIQQGIDLWNVVHRRFRDAVNADPTDARARFDLAALDLSLAEGYDGLQRSAEALAAYREFAEGMNILVSQDGNNATWRFHRAEALIHVGLEQIKLRDTAAGNRSIDAGVREIVGLVEGMESDANRLRIAADFLCETHRDPRLALRFAERAVVTQKHASADSLVTLARARRGAGQITASRAAAQEALRLLALHPQGLGNAGLTTRARALSDSADDAAGGAAARGGAAGNAGGAGGAPLRHRG